MVEFDYGEAGCIPAMVHEHTWLQWFGHSPEYCFHVVAAVVVNQDGRLEATVEEIEAILLAEKRRVARRCSLP